MRNIAKEPMYIITTESLVKRNLQRPIQIPVRKSSQRGRKHPISHMVKWFHSFLGWLSSPSAFLGSNDIALLTSNWLNRTVPINSSGSSSSVFAYKAPPNTQNECQGDYIEVQAKWVNAFNNGLLEALEGDIFHDRSRSDRQASHA